MACYDDWCCSACWYHVIAYYDWRIGVLHWCYVCMCSNWGTHGRRHVLLTEVLFAVHLRSDNDVFALSYDETTGAFNMLALDIAMYLCLHAHLTLEWCSSYNKSTTLILLWMTREGSGWVSAFPRQHGTSISSHVVACNAHGGQEWHWQGCRAVKFGWSLSGWDGDCLVDFGAAAISIWYLPLVNQSLAFLRTRRWEPVGLEPKAVEAWEVLASRAWNLISSSLPNSSSSSSAGRLCSSVSGQMLRSMCRYRSPYSLHIVHQCLSWRSTMAWLAKNASLS